MRWKYSLQFTSLGGIRITSNHPDQDLVQSPRSGSRPITPIRISSNHADQDLVQSRRSGSIPIAQIRITSNHPNQDHVQSPTSGSRTITQIRITSNHPDQDLVQSPRSGSRPITQIRISSNHPDQDLVQSPRSGSRPITQIRISSNHTDQDLVQSHSSLVLFCKILFIYMQCLKATFLLRFLSICDLFWASVHVIFGINLGGLQIQIRTALILIFQAVNRLTAIRVKFCIIRFFTKLSETSNYIHTAIKFGIFI
jgi:hypothetical protein